tara:strand:+ start:169 stop:405 length:237 start_codon:yes stop_codon:yes gene_type:complete
MGHETKIRSGSLIIESSYIFSNPNSRHEIKSYGIVLSIDRALGIEIFWFDDNRSNFYSKDVIEWFLDGTITKFWTIRY